MFILYGLIVLAATTIGAVFGIGGGIIIKPVLEAASGEPLVLINALSGVTVLSMAAFSTLRYIRDGQKPNSDLFSLALGSVAGGFLGKYLFDIFIRQMPEKNAKAIQYAILIMIFIIITQKKWFPQLNIKNTPMFVSSGIVLGAISSFLGIGGGPLNIPAISMLMGVDSKRAAVYSIFVILCSQAASLGVSLASNGYAGLNMTPLFAMIPASIAGGFIGPFIHRKMRAESFEKYFNLLLWLLIALNVYNIWSVLYGR